MAEALGGVAPGTAATARRSLVLAAVAVIAASRLAGPPAIWPVAALVAVGVLTAALHALAVTDSETRTAGVPVEALFLPVVAAFGAVGVLQLVPPGLALLAAIAIVAWVLDQVVGLEARLVSADRAPSDTERTQVLVWAIVVAFVGFTGTAALVPGGLPEPGVAAPDAGLDERGLVTLAVVDALVAGLVGYRIVALRVPELGLAVASALTYAGVIAIGAATLRAADIPRLVGPALLTLVVFLWDAFHAPPSGARRDPRWFAQVVLLVVLGGVVTLWNLALR